VEGKNKEAAT